MTNQLADPFARIFTDWAEANWAFDLLRDAVRRLRVTGPYDPRVAVTLSQRSGRDYLRLNFGGWLVLGFRSPGQSPERVELTLLGGLVAWDERFASFSFERKGSEPEVRSYDLPPEVIRPMTSDVRRAFETTLDFIADKFQRWKKSTRWKHHNPEIIEACFDPERRAQLLATGLSDFELRYERHFTAFHLELAEEEGGYEAEVEDAIIDATGDDLELGGRLHMEDSLNKLFEEFSSKPHNKFMVKLRRKRAAEIRELLASPENIDLETFTREVWLLQSDVYLGGKDIGQLIDLYGVSGTFPENIDELEQALEVGELEFHGNSIWGTATRVFAPRLKDDTEKLQHIRQAVKYLNDSTLSPQQKFDKIMGVYGFGRNIASGLVMVFHPNNFCITNSPSEQALKKLGYTSISSIEDFQAVLHRLKKQVEAEDFLELDWFLYLLNRDNLDEKYEHQPAGYFNHQTFQLLAGLSKNPTLEFYTSRKSDFKKHLLQPFKQLFYDVADQLPSEITDVMETEKYLFSRIPKNDFGQGGAWDFYWAAFYPKEGKRTEDAQLLMWIKHERLEFGFYIGEYGDKLRKQFLENCQTHYDALLELLPPVFAGEKVIFGKHDEIAVTPDGKVESKLNLSWPEWLQNPQVADFSATVGFTAADVLSFSQVQLLNKIVDTYTRFFPLVLLAKRDAPLPEIEDYCSKLLPALPELEPVSVAEIHDTSYDAGADEALKSTPNPTLSLADLAGQTGFSEEELERWVRAIERKGQAILYGPPGTGKTYLAENLATHLIGGGDGFRELVQFHPAYAYEDFMQGIRPQSEDGRLTYPMLPGRFLEFCRRAAKRSGRCVLIIDEINRANLARVFGELMYLLEYRSRSIPLAGDGTRFQIPANVRLIGAMNTADRSIALVDHALRRRFAFIRMQPNFEVLRRFHHTHSTGFPVEALIAVLETLNNQIDDPNYAVGITFFLDERLADHLPDIWQMEIEPYLEEYFFSQPAEVEPFRWEAIRQKLA